MQYLAPTNVFEGVVQLNQAPTADSHAVTRAYLESNAVVGIATDSANKAEALNYHRCGSGYSGRFPFSLGNFQLWNRTGKTRR